jgi:RND family efflux transporter MFP subunit
VSHETPPVRRRRPQGRTIVLLAVLAAVLIAAYGIWSRFRTTSEQRATAEDASIARVELVQPRPSPPTRTLTLPGNLEGWFQSSLYGQVTGYISRWYKDYGAQVKAGDLLATIDTPGLDAELAQAKAQLASTQANYDLAVVTAKRWQALAGTQAVAQQDVDIRTANAKAEAALVEAARQNLARYQALASFKNVVAPFDGVVIARNVNLGDYVGAQGAQANQRTQALPLFLVATNDPLRVFVSVPQAYSDGLRPGMSATMTLLRDPGVHVPLKLLTTARAVEPAQRSVVTELVLPNPKHEYLPGAYVNVTFEFPADPGLLIVPQQAVLFRAQGPQVAVIGPGSRARFKNVTLGRNLGSDVEITSGLNRDDKLVAAPSMGLLDGQQVKAVQPAPGGVPGANRSARK